VGVDGVTQEQYAQDLEQNLRDLHEREVARAWARAFSETPCGPHRGPDAAARLAADARRWWCNAARPIQI